jgi:hypothetical protein
MHTARSFMAEYGWDRMCEIARSPKHRDAFKALELIAAYAYGKPQQHVDLTTGGESLLAVVRQEDLALLEHNPD